MQIEISGEIEELIVAELSAGNYRTAEECVAAILRNWQSATGERASAIPKDIDIDALVAHHGVLPIRELAQLKADFWPEDESVDEFIAAIRSGCPS